MLWGGVVQARGPLGVGHAASAEAAGGTPGVCTPGLATSPLRLHRPTEGTRSREGSKDQSSSAHSRPRLPRLHLLSGRAGAGSRDTEHMALDLGPECPTKDPGKLRGP